jgi:hypothetical protein
MLINLKHLGENSCKIRFLFEIRKDVMAKQAVMRGKRSPVALQKLQNRIGLTLG